MTPNVTCHKCGNEFYKKPYLLKRHDKHFCKRKCQIAFIRESNPRIKLACTHCGDPIERRRSELRKSYNNIYFCDNTCKNRHLNSIRWEDLENTTSHAHKRELVMARHNSKCIACGYGEDLRMIDVHHMDGNHQNNDLSNLYPACVWCHTRHHRCKEPISIGIWKSDKRRLTL
jgi:hypothetical protein